jgi:hydrogenase maturation protease
MRHALSGHARRADVTIIGIGNLFRGDDGVGLLAVRRLREQLPDVRIVECDGDLPGILDGLRSESALIVIDAMRSAAAPGTVHRIEAHAQPLPAGLFRTSSHAVGIAEVVELARALGQLPGCFIFYGIEGARFAPGDSISPPVRRGLTEVVARVIDEVRGHA